MVKMRLSQKLIEETRALIRLYLFLRRDCGLMYADKLSAKNLKRLLRTLSQRKHFTKGMIEV
ncbi:MAG: hypothetical protein A2166_06425 [Omnitrophica WOR_2 bacterium RBG_13_41_10]|nr:MAG: hypothetical protein A2166_06425 [Omnitrophica WOR_2 bacterium RBG_13_41_10]